MSYRPNLVLGQSVATLTDAATLPSSTNYAAGLLTLNIGGIDYKSGLAASLGFLTTSVAQVLSDSTGTITVDLTLMPVPSVYDCILSGTGRTIAVTGIPVSGQSVFRVRLTGSGTVTTYPGPPKWRGGSAPTLTGRDEIVFERVGSEWWVSAGSFA